MPKRPKNLKKEVPNVNTPASNIQNLRKSLYYIFYIFIFMQSLTWVVLLESQQIVVSGALSLKLEEKQGNGMQERLSRSNLYTFVTYVYVIRLNCK